jgi:hypothetical protein
MKKSIEITLNSDGTWGDTDMDGIDAKASEAKLEQMIADAVVAEYEGYEVEVSSAQLMNTKVEIYDGTNEPTDDDVENIRETVGYVWSSWDWVIEE